MTMGIAALNPSYLARKEKTVTIFDLLEIRPTISVVKHQRHSQELFMPSSYLLRFKESTDVLTISANENDDTAQVRLGDSSLNGEEFEVSKLTPVICGKRLTKLIVLTNPRGYKDAIELALTTPDIGQAEVGLRFVMAASMVFPRFVRVEPFTSEDLAEDID